MLVPGCSSPSVSQNRCVKVLITGGAGFIGSCLADHLLTRGVTVRVLDDLSTGRRSSVSNDVEFIEGDISDPTTVARAMEQVEVVYHQAAHRSVFRSVESPMSTDRVNVGGTLAVLIAARDAGVRRVVSASSSSVYGNEVMLPTPETAVPRPRSPYAVSKLAGEHYCRVFWELYGLETVSLRYFNVYGPRQSAEGQYATVIPLFIEAMRAGRAVDVHGDGTQSRDFTFIDDVVSCNVAAAMSAPERCAGRVFNVAGGSPVSVLGVLDAVADAMGSRPSITLGPARAGDVLHTHADLSAVTSALGWRPRTGFGDGIQQTVRWFLGQPS